MAQIDYENLTALIRQAPEYDRRLKAAVPVETALYVRFLAAPPEGVESETFQLANGSELVLDRGPDGRVYRIEIV